MTGVGLLAAMLAGVAPPPPEPAPADPAIASSEEAATAGIVVLGVLEGDAPFEPEALAVVLDGSFASTDYEVRVQRIHAADDLLARMQWAKRAADGGVVAVYWIEPAPNGSHRLYLFDPQTERIWLRELPGGTDAGLVLESLGIILRSQTMLLSEGEPTGMEEAESPEEPKPEPEPERQIEPPVERDPAPTPPPPPVQIGVGIHYVGGNVGDSLVWDNGVGVRLDAELRAAVLLRLDAATNIPRRVSAEPRITFGRIPVALSAGYRFRRGADLRPEVDLGVVVEATYWRSRDGSNVEGRSGRSARVALAPGAGMIWTFWRGLGAHLHVRADIWLLNHDLVLTDSGGSTQQTRLRTHPLAATLHGGLHYRF